MTNFGDINHDIISFVRLTKEPKDFSRIIRKRSFKYFDKDQFLQDVANTDWLDILCCFDLDEVVHMFTDLF